MRGKEKLLQGVKELGKQLRNKKTALLGAIKSSSRALTKKAAGVKSSLRKLAKGGQRSSG
jgi:hypothetical protein